MLRSLFVCFFCVPLVTIALAPRLAIFVCKALDLGAVCMTQPLGLLESVLCLVLLVMGYVVKRVYLYLYPVGDTPERCGCACAFLNGTICHNLPVQGPTKTSSLCSRILPDGGCDCPCNACHPDDQVLPNWALLHHLKLWVVRQIIRLGFAPFVVLSVTLFLVRDVWSHVTATMDLLCLWVLVLLSLLVKPWIGIVFFMSGFLLVDVGAVCMHCNDQLEGCMGGDTCAFVTGQNTNAALVATVGALATGAALSVGSMLPRPYLTVLTRSVLDSLLSLTRRVLPGASVSLAGKTVDQLLKVARDNSAPAADVLGELSTLIPGATPDERDQIKLAIEFVRTFKEVSKTSSTASSSSGEAVGVLRYLWALSGKIVLRGTSTVTVSLDREAGVSGSQRLSEKIHRPVTMEQFTDMLFTFAAICHALGVCNFLLWTSFARVVVFDVMLTEGYSWQFAHELLMVYFEDIDASSVLNFHSIVTDGSTDRRRRLAEVNVKDHYPKTPIFRPGGGGGGDGGGGPSGDGSGTKKPWNGRFTKGSKQSCQDWNAGKSCTRLHPNGTCQYNHVCDRWLVGKGKDAVCGSCEHRRINCDNPDKGPRQTE